MRGEELFLRGLYELAGGEGQHQISNIFGRDGSAQSRAFSWFINHIHTAHAHLVHNSLGWWKDNGFFSSSAAAIALRIGPTVIDLEDRQIAHFIDCNCLPTSVVGGGPTDAGPHSPRWDETIQRSFYNGWKSIHGLKHQTVNNAYGFTVDMCGPTTLTKMLYRLSSHSSSLIILLTKIVQFLICMRIFYESRFTVICAYIEGTFTFHDYLCIT